MRLPLRSGLVAANASRTKRFLQKGVLREEFGHAPLPKFERRTGGHQHQTSERAFGAQQREQFIPMHAR